MKPVTTKFLMGKKNNKFLNKIYSQPLPITLTSSKYNVSLPNLYPHNPISWIWYIIRYCQINIVYQVPELHNPPLSVIYENQIFKVIDRESMLKLWRQGFFGKGILSISYPTWEKRTITRLNLDNSNNGKDLAMEDITKKRREERKFFKLERARFQELELKKRQGIITDEEVEEMNKLEIQLTELRKIQVRFDKQENGEVKEIHIRDEDEDIITENGELLPLEFLQLQEVETFFLKFALQRIDIVNVDSLLDLFYKCCSHHSFSPIPTSNNQFIIEYIAYHYFRTNGWCVRSGIKFGTDFLLYKRGPPFTHAEFCVLVMTKDSKYDWFQIAAKARVIGSVKKAFVLCYIEYPTQEEFDQILQKQNEEDIDHGLLLKELLSKYKFSEVIYKRWNPSRTRD